MEDLIYVLSLEELLFIPEKIDRLFEFFQKNPTELAIQYHANPKSLPKDLIGRLSHEADEQTLKILENDKYSNLRPNDPVIAQISKKISVDTRSGKIML